MSLPKRALGSTGAEIPVVGFPGIVLTAEALADPAKAKSYVEAAVASGFTYIDVAPEYGDGIAQARLGPALEGSGLREQCFLACKTMFRAAEVAEKDLATSLKALKTDYFDLYQCHSVTTAADVDAILAPGGALEAMVAAKAAGKIRHIGFSAHDEDQALRLIDTGKFETVMFPFNYVSFTRCNVGKRLLAAAVDKGMGIIALKAMARGRLKPKGETEPTFIGMDLSNSLGQGTVGDASKIKHVPQEILATYKYEHAVIVHEKFRTWYTPESDPEKMKKLLRFSLGLSGVTSAICPGSDDLFLSVQSMSNFDEFVKPLNEEDLSYLMEEYANVEPIFHTGKGGNMVSHSYT